METSRTKLGQASGFGCTQESCTTLGEEAFCHYLEIKLWFKTYVCGCQVQKGWWLCDMTRVLLFSQILI